MQGEVGKSRLAEYKTVRKKVDKWQHESQLNNLTNNRKKQTCSLS